MITIDELKAKLGGMKTAVDDLRDAWPSWSTR